MIKIETNLKDLERVLKKYPKAIEGAVSIALKRMGQEARNIAMDNAPLKSGDLRRSILMSPQMPKTRVTVGSNKVYARIQDLGGVIRPIKGQYLTIPLGGTKGSIRGHTGGFFRRSKKGNLIYFVKAGKGIKPLFVLKKQVTLKAQPYLSKAFDVISKGRGGKIIGEELNHVIKSLR
jgi:hypothetical protein